MERTVDVSGTLLMVLLYGITLVGLAVILLVAANPLDSDTNVLLAPLLVLFGVLTIVGAWRRLTGNDGAVRPDAPYDIAYDPFAYPGQAAKHNWQKAIHRLQTDENAGDSDDERD